MSTSNAAAPPTGGAPLDVGLPTSREGPWLQSVTTRLLGLPGDFLRPDVATRALLADTVELVGAEPSSSWSTVDDLALPTRLAVHVGCWLLVTPDLAGSIAGQSGSRLVGALTVFATLVDAVPLRSWSGDDPDRHDEVGRALLRSLGLRPRGESHDVAEDTWQSLSTSLRRDALRRAAVEQQRADELARRLADQRAKEAAAQYTNV